MPSPVHQALLMSHPVSDPSFSLVKLLLGFEGTNGDTTTVDESPSPRTLVFEGSSAIDTAQQKFGVSSLNSSTSGIHVLNGKSNTDFNTLSASGWTFEGFFRFNSVAGDQGLFGNFNPPSEGYFIRYTGGTLAWFNQGYTGFNGSWSPSTATWYHIAVSYDGTKARIFVDGVMNSSATGTNHGFTGANLDFGVGVQAGGGGRALNGWVDEFRFTNGACRYASDGGFTVPTAAYPRS